MISDGDCRIFKGTSGGLAVQFGACDDSQTAADTAALSKDRVSTGAATFLFIQAIEHLSASGLHNVTYAPSPLFIRESISQLFWCAEFLCCSLCRMFVMQLSQWTDDEPVDLTAATN
jgi:hypothetical protein